MCVMAWVGCAEERRSEPVEGAPYGAPCEGNDDCASGACLMSAEPSCTQRCLDDCDCPAGAVCTRVDETLSVCAPGENACTAAGDGGTPPEDVGATDGSTDSATSGAGPAGPCTEDSDCAPVRSAGGTGSTPEIMTVPQECWPEATTGFPGGLCSMTDCATNFRRDPCPTDTACIALTAGSVCLQTCGDGASCRSGWVCRDDVDAAGPAHEQVCWLPCSRSPCATGFTCQPDGTCVEEVVAPGPLDGCTNWDDWSCVDRSPTMCSCSCAGWPHAGNAPRVVCELVAAGAVACTCTTGGEATSRESATLDLSASGADCGQARTAFEGAFCGLTD